jgi:hypothetical protein
MEVLSNLFSSVIGAISYTVVVFVAGTFLGKPLWDWASPKFPWNKK